MSIGIFSCSLFEDAPDEEVTLLCGVSDPINELNWLNEQYQSIENITQSGIILYRYKDQEVIEIQSSLMSSTNLSQYYCNGTKLEFDTPKTYEGDYQDFLSNRVRIKILYGVDLWGL